MFVQPLPPRREPGDQTELTLRDRIAVEAMSSLLSGPAAGPAQTFAEYAEEAYRMADAMLAARDRSYSQNDEKRRVSNTKQPVAWAVTIGPESDLSVYEAFAEHQYDDAVRTAKACLFGGKGRLPLVPLHFGLSADEKAALREAAESFEYDSDDEECGRIAKTIRSLLERLT